MIKQVGLIRFSIHTVFEIFQNVVMILCLYSNIKSNHPLNKVLDDMRTTIRSGRYPQHQMSWLHFGIVFMMFHSFIKQFVSSNEELINTYNNYMKIATTYCQLGQFIIPLGILSKRTSQLSDSLLMFHSREDVRRFIDTRALVLEQIRLERIYWKLVDYYYFYLALIVFDSLYRAIIGLYLFAGMLLEFVPEANLFSDNSKSSVAYIHFAISLEALYKVWCVAHAAASANYQVALSWKLF